ncbi:nodulation protein NopA [Rhizobium leguminosarum bv. viciae]|nr:nodulation protein NopA [Rhizobium leguminosarum bv. viciae]NKL60113.1 nodulation protein NopA [Rhizobium leguminosarum bv. viciae]
MVDKVGNVAGTGAAVVTDIAAKGAGEAAFQTQIAELTAASLKATERSVTVRTVTTELGSIKKVADERVQ